ncbi:hypothetical protein [Methylobacterium sp. SyP6R]|uniref:hypothetical protein n=1 Tax=Methylobacterium sp. SyP6R TaxID=2718876 RepID=UPI001F489BA9|nr:hypothetical protein [Methylobacterium sp. SyP6R]MCF4124554.1 hypothetical protein [Methylobacterium sp. SyP6R]
MLTILRIVTAAAILAGASPARPVMAAHIVPIDREGAAGAASHPGGACPLRAWPYIG